MIDFFNTVIPSGERILYAIGGAIGATANFLFGSLDLPFCWLITIAAIDFGTGMWAGIKTEGWVSEVCHQGIVKKSIVLMLVALAHGVDVVSGAEWLREAVIFAFVVSEFGSILENIGRAGYEAVIPSVLRTALKVLKEKSEQTGIKGGMK